TFLPGLLFLPTLSIAAVVYFGGHDVIGGTLTYGEFFLFYQLLLQLVSLLEALCWILSLAPPATPSGARGVCCLHGMAAVPRPASRCPLPASSCVPTCPRPAPTRPATRSSPPATPRASPTSRSTCPTATTR